MQEDSIVETIGARGVYTQQGVIVYKKKAIYATKNQE